MGGCVMARVMKEKTLINKINRTYPGVNATPLAEFYGDETKEGIWFRGSEGDPINGEPVYNYWNARWAETFGVNPEFDAFIEKHGWHCENYDSGTLMAYPG